MFLERKKIFTNSAQPTKEEKGILAQFGSRSPRSLDCTHGSFARPPVLSSSLAVSHARTTEKRRRRRPAPEPRCSQDWGQTTAPRPRPSRPRPRRPGPAQATAPPPRPPRPRPRRPCLAQATAPVPHRPPRPLPRRPGPAPCPPAPLLFSARTR